MANRVRTVTGEAAGLNNCTNDSSPATPACVAAVANARPLRISDNQRSVFADTLTVTPVEILIVIPCTGDS
jgi:hypothetical protein